MLHTFLSFWVVPLLSIVKIRTHSVSVVETSQLMTYREVDAVCSQNYISNRNTLYGNNLNFLSVGSKGLISVFRLG
jgi:hypothetical protein